jgi:SAM-dependent methyltransferase
VYKEMLHHQLGVLQHLRHARGPVRRLLEYGCGVAPVTTSYVEFCPLHDRRILLADIEAISFHYARWKFAEFAEIQPVSLLPEKNFALTVDEPLDAIFCLAVFEHLNQPLETIKAFHRALRPGGVLIFDYIRSEADGLDTTQGLRERAEVMRYLAEHFHIRHGKLDAENSITLTVASPK